MSKRSIGLQCVLDEGKFGVSRLFVLVVVSVRIAVCEAD